MLGDSTYCEVFLSYAREDRDLMQDVLTQLVKSDLDVWVDYQLKLGGTWTKEIEQAIENALCMVVILSPNAKNSDWVRNEVDYARTLGKPIFPLLRGARDKSIPIQLIGKTTIRLVQDTFSDLNRLIEGIQELIHNFSQGIPEAKLAHSDGDITGETSAIESTLRPFGSAIIRELYPILETATAIFSQPEKPPPRASLYLIDPEREELYIVAATQQHFEDDELLVRYPKGEHVVGRVWSEEKYLLMQPEEPELDLLGLTGRQRADFFFKIGFMIALPIFSSSYQIIGVLVIDGPEPLWTSNTLNMLEDLEHNNWEMQLKVNQALELVNTIENIFPSSAKPLHYYIYNNLEYVLRIARLLPSFPRKDDLLIRASIFHQVDKRLYILVSSKGFESNELHREFAVTEGLVGYVSRHRVVFVEDWNKEDQAFRDYYIERFFGVKLEQMESKKIEQITGSMLQINSILAVPIYNQNNDVLGVLTISSRSPLKESRLNAPSVIADAMRLANLAGRLLQQDEELRRP